MLPSHVTRASIPKSSNRSIRMEWTRIRPRGRLSPVIIGNWSTSKICLSRSDQSLKSDFRQPWISSTVFLSRIRQIWIHTHYKPSKIPQSNGEAEHMVQVTKNLLTRDSYEALLAYRATPLENGFSPAELRMARRLCTTLPTTSSKVTPQWPELTNLPPSKQKSAADDMQFKSLSNLSPSDCLYIPDRKENAVVVAKTPEPCSYYLDTDSNATVWRNQTDGSSIQILKEQSTQQEALYPILLKLRRISHLFWQRRMKLYDLLKSLSFQFPFQQPLLFPGDKLTRPRD